MKKIATIDCTTGIYETEYTLFDDNGEMVVKAPFIKWDNNNTGVLDFELMVVDKKAQKYVKEMFESGELVDDDGMTMDDYIYGRVSFV